MIIDRVRGSHVADRRRPRPDPLTDRLRTVREWAARDHPEVIPIAEAARGDIATVAGLVERLRVDPVDRRLHAVVSDSTGEIRVSWPFADRPSVLPGQGVLVRGRLRRTPWAEMLNPRIVVAPRELVEVSVGG